MSAQQQHAGSGMKFVGKGLISAMQGMVTQDNPSDTVEYIGGKASASFVIPAMSHPMLSMPSFQIDGTTFSGGYAGVTWPEQEFTVAMGEETMQGTLSGTFTHTNGIYELKLTLTLIYSAITKMAGSPVPVTYTIDGFYLKETSGKLDVNVAGGVYSAPSVTYVTRTYLDGDVTKVDVQTPSYTLEDTPMGNISVGSYTVQGLTWDEAQNAYYKDYSNDGLKLYFSNGANLNGEYPLDKAGQTIAVQFNGTSVSSLVNTFQPGNMPFGIISTFPGTTSGINSVSKNANTQTGEAYNLAGQQVGANAKGIVIINGKKILK